MKISETRYRFLIQQYKNNIYSYSMYMLKNKVDAEDVTQEILIRIWENINDFKFNSAKAWIMRSTHNLCIDYLRKRKISQQKESSIDDYIIETKPDERKENDPQISTHIKMMTIKVKQAIERLPEKLRSVLVLYELQGLKYKEISKALNVPINTVKVNLLRARKKLQEELKHYEINEVI